MAADSDSDFPPGLSRAARARRARRDLDTACLPERIHGRGKKTGGRVKMARGQLFTRASLPGRSLDGSAFLEFPTESGFLTLTDHCHLRLRLGRTTAPATMHGVHGAWQWHDHG